MAALADKVPAARRRVDALVAKLGAMHTDTLSAKTSLASLLEDDGELGEARTIYEEVVAAFSAQLGPRTRWEPSCSARFCSSSRSLGAARCTKRWWRATRHNQGPSTRTRKSKRHLATVLKEHGEPDQARTMYEEAVASFSAQLGRAHETLENKMNLTLLLGS